MAPAGQAAAGPLPKNVKGWITQLAQCDQVWQVGEFDFDQPLVLDGERLYLRRYWRDETLVARTIRTRSRELRPVDTAQARIWLDLLFDADAHAAPPDWQKLACAMALRGSVAIITGGPGTGKTYTVARLLALLFAMAPDAQRQRVALAAPTGKAAARLEAIDRQGAHRTGRQGRRRAAAARADRPHGRGAHPA
ncbi:AAA family ATPase [Massilia sp. B-10]|nr:AAA family ATPase [Massilia sp. B-10]